VDAGVSDLLRIGEAAELTEVSTRTLRYYEQLGLVTPTGRSAGGARRYSEVDLARVHRIRELQELMGFDLQQIRVIVAAEARLQELREEYQRTDRPANRQRLVGEAIEINDRLREEVRGKLKRTKAFLADLERKAAKYREALAQTEPVGASRS
jgi:DNA-binding transcriptional MerR regulator